MCTLCREDMLPKVIICGVTEDNMPKILICDSDKKPRRPRSSSGRPRSSGGDARSRERRSRDRRSVDRRSSQPPSPYSGIPPCFPPCQMLPPPCPSLPAPCPPMPPCPPALPCQPVPPCIAKRLSDSYDMQEKLAADNVDLEGKR